MMAARAPRVLAAQPQQDAVVRRYAPLLLGQQDGEGSSGDGETDGPSKASLLFRSYSGPADWGSARPALDPAPRLHSRFVLRAAGDHVDEAALAHLAARGFTASSVCATVA
jgi:hypothetical protein